MKPGEGVALEQIPQWQVIVTQEINPDETLNTALGYVLVEDETRLVANGPNGSVFVASKKGEVLRISAMKLNMGLYCFWEFPWDEERLTSILGSQTIKVRDLHAAMVEDPIISKLTREQAAALLGIEG